MQEEKVVFADLEYPNVSINGRKHELLFEFTSRQGADCTVYVESEESSVVVKLNGSQAICGMFSLRGEAVYKLLDYIESNMRKPEDFICYEAATMETLLRQADKQGRHYPVLSEAVGPLDLPALSFTERSAHRARALFSGAWMRSELNRHTVRVVNEAPLDRVGELVQEKSQIKQSRKARTRPLRESVANMDNSLLLGKHDIGKLMRQVEGNAWFGIEPRNTQLLAGTDVIEISGRVIEPFYEDFCATASISFNGKELYGLESRNIAAYRNETYHTGQFDTPQAAVAFLREATKGKEILAVGETKRPLGAAIAEAQAKKEEQTAKKVAIQQEVSR